MCPPYNARCTCMQVWMSVLPPPPCPVHSLAGLLLDLIDQGKVWTTTNTSAPASTV